MALGALAGLWMFRRELYRSGLPESGIDAAMAGLLGGLAGAKLLWVFEHFGEEPLQDLLRTHRRLALSRAPVRARIAVMRKLAAQDPANPIWPEDLKI